MRVYGSFSNCHWSKHQDFVKGSAYWRVLAVRILPTCSHTDAQARPPKSLENATFSRLADWFLFGRVIGPHAQEQGHRGGLRTFAHTLYNMEPDAAGPRSVELQTSAVGQLSGNVGTCWGSFWQARIGSWTRCSTLDCGEGAVYSLHTVTNRYGKAARP